LSGYLVTPQYPIEDSTCESMRQFISRDPGEEVTIYRDKMIFLAKVDVGAYGKQAFYIDLSGSVSMLAGEPLLDLGDGDTLRTREEDLEILHKAWDNRDPSCHGHLRLIRLQRGGSAAV
jgi:hypothetical protein